MARTARRTRLIALGAIAAATLGGCSFTNPIMTQQPYEAGDGIRVAVRDDVVAVENLMVLTEEQGESGYVLGSLVNRTPEPVTLTLDFGGQETVTFTVGARDNTNLTEQRVTLDEVPVAPGAKLPAIVSTEHDGTFEAHVPVLDGAISPYDEYLEAAREGEDWEPRAVAD